jgi:hypothetical protein
VAPLAHHVCAPHPPPPRPPKVLTARDRWLRPGGAVLPDIATIHVAAADDRALGVDFWEVRGRGERSHGAPEVEVFSRMG